jgi:hypothetical protein
MPCQGRSERVFVYRKWSRADHRMRTGQRASRDKVLAMMVRAFASARTQTRFSVFGFGRMVPESGISDLGYPLELNFACQLAATFYRKPGRTAKVGQCECPDTMGPWLANELLDEPVRGCAGFRSYGDVSPRSCLPEAHNSDISEPGPCKSPPHSFVVRFSFRNDRLNVCLL